MHNENGGQQVEAPRHGSQRFLDKLELLSLIMYRVPVRNSKSALRVRVPHCPLTVLQDTVLYNGTRFCFPGYPLCTPYLPARRFYPQNPKLRTPPAARMQVADKEIGLLIRSDEHSIVVRYRGNTRPATHSHSA